MNWRWKARVQKIVAALPMSESIYYGIQRAAGNLRPGRHDPTEWFHVIADFGRWSPLRPSDLEGKSFLEIGTGRRLDIPIALWLCGVERIVTVDRNRYLSMALVRETLDGLRRNRPDLVALFGEEASRSRFRERLRSLVAFSGGLDELLTMMNVTYLVTADATRLPFPAASFDFHFSHVVMQHIPAPALRQLLTDARRLLVPGGRLIHFIDLSDMYSHDDPSIPAVNCLRFSDAEWERTAQSRYLSQTRLRVHEYLQIFEQTGMQIIAQAQAVDEPSLTLLKSGTFPLDPRFRGIAPELLAVCHLRVLGAFPH
jgi:SAM-dependent methyltransferase